MKKMNLFRRMMSLTLALMMIVSLPLTALAEETTGTVDVETTAGATETVMTAENFVKDMSVTVMEKAEGHLNNADADNTNDAYVTELTFALVVTPSTENGDDRIVKIISNDGVVREYRLAGENKEGQNLETLVCDESGNYTVKDLVLTEGSQQFNISLEGIQNLKEGVYLYSSEIRDVEGSEVSSQTMVGLAEGDHAVNVSMTINFQLDVDNEIIVSEHVWRDQWTNPSNPPYEPPHNPPEEPMMLRFRREPEEEEEEEEIILDELVPLANAPNTGDDSGILLALAAFSAIGLTYLALIQKREEV